MPKNAFSEWSETPGNNTDIAGINIGEGCPPSNLNDAVRSVMAQLIIGAPQTGTGVGQAANRIKLGKSSISTALKATVDVTDLGNIWTDSLAAFSLGTGVGWFRLPNSFLIQYGFFTGTTNAGGALVTTFPTAFSNTNYRVIAWNDDSTAGGYVKHFQGGGFPSTTQFAPLFMNDGGTLRASASARVAYIAIGT